MTSQTLNYELLIDAINQAHQQAQTLAVTAVNRHLILRNWLIGAHIVEFEQQGEDRAVYGAGLLKKISSDLKERGVPGCAVRMLERMRVFYLAYPQVASAISSSAMTKLLKPLQNNTLEYD